MTAFTPEVYERIREGCQRSAEAVIPRLYELIGPTTVADIGGGEGWWGRAFYDRGCSVLVADDSIDVMRFEAAGGPEARRIDFLPVDLQLRGWASRVAAERSEIARIHGGSPTFDLAVCLEVAEHLPADRAEDLVAGLCAIAPCVVFSAAIPGQGGHGHVNEQPPGYWSAMFEGYGFEVSGDLRWSIWNDSLVEPWYRQNLLVAADRRRMNPDDWNYLGGELFGPTSLCDPLYVVHPDIWQWRLSDIRELRGQQT